jgi:hypothetical protein
MAWRLWQGALPRGAHAGFFTHRNPARSELFHQHGLTGLGGTGRRKLHEVHTRWNGPPMPVYSIPGDSVCACSYDAAHEYSDLLTKQVVNHYTHRLGPGDLKLQGDIRGRRNRQHPQSISCSWRVDALADSRLIRPSLHQIDIVLRGTEGIRGPYEDEPTVRGLLAPGGPVIPISSISGCPDRIPIAET